MKKVGGMVLRVSSTAASLLSIAVTPQDTQHIGEGRAILLA